MEEQRKVPRRNLKVYLKVFDDGTGDLFGHMVDITREGILLTTEGAVEVDKIHRLRLEVPSEIQESRRFVFSALSKWCEKDSEFDAFNSGFRFQELPPEDARWLDRVIQTFCFKR